MKNNMQTAKRLAVDTSVSGFLAISIVAAALSAPAPAAVIFTNFGPSLSYDTAEGNPVGNDFAGDNAAEADSFIPGGEAQFTSVSLALSCVGMCPAAEDFSISLAADNGDAPGAAIETFIFSGRNLSALGNSNTPITATSVLHPVLFGGTRYWIAAGSSTDFAIAWNLNSTGDASDQAISTDGGSTWFSPSGMTPSALQVNGNFIPEPSAAFLIGTGLLMAMAGRIFTLRRHRKPLGAGTTCDFQATTISSEAQ